MDRAAFQGSPAGKLITTPSDQWAFVPNPLPPAIDLAPLALPLAKTALAVGELNGVGGRFPNPYLLIRPLQTQEALTSSAMEGTQTSVSDLLLLEAGADEAERPPDTREVLNYVHALRSAIQSLETLPLCVRTLKQAHHTLLTGVRGERGANVVPGDLKREQNFIGATRNIRDARFVPPPPRESESALSDLEKYINREDRSDAHPLIDAALIHYQFETIHPFPDGNGRVGRMLIPLFLIERKVLVKPLLYLSPVLESRKAEYTQRLFEVSRVGAWIGWLTFFLEVTEQAARKAIGLIERLLSLQETYRSRLHTARRSALQLRLCELVFHRPVVSIPYAQNQLQVTYRTAQNCVEGLVEKQILEEVPNTSHPKFFRAKEILDAISG